MRKPILSKKKREEIKRNAQEKVDSYVEAAGKRKPAQRQSYRERCGHCKGTGRIGGGKDCRNCANGWITRYR